MRTSHTIYCCYNLIQHYMTELGVISSQEFCYDVLTPDRVLLVRYDHVDDWYVEILESCKCKLENNYQ